MKKMVQVKKIMAVLISAVMFAAAFTGCGKKNEIDPVKTVQAVMDAELKGNFDEYVKLSGEDTADLQERYDEVIDELVSVLTDEYESFAAEDIEQDALKEVAKDMLASAKYEVQEAEKDENGNYTVNVAIYPSDLIEKAIQAAVKTILENPESESGDLIIDAFHTGLEDQTYGEAVICPVRLILDDDDQYEVNQDDLEAIGSKLYTLPEELVVATGKDYGNVYLNWMKEDWENASDEEKTNCCLAVLQKMIGLSDEDMAVADTSDPVLQEGIQMMMIGISDIYDSELNMSVGDFTEYMMSLGMDFTE